MDEMVCLECGKEMEYDWAPCQNCGWKAPEPWEMDNEDDKALGQRPILDKPRPWVHLTVWSLLVLGLLGLLAFLVR